MSFVGLRVPAACGIVMPIPLGHFGLNALFVIDCPYADDLLQRRSALVGIRVAGRRCAGAGKPTAPAPIAAS